MSLQSSNIIMTTTALVVALVAVAVVFLAPFFNTTTTTTTTVAPRSSVVHCQSDSMVEFSDWLQPTTTSTSSTTSSSTPFPPPFVFRVHPCSVFSHSYVQARQRFREAVAKLPFAELFTLPIHVNKEEEEEEKINDDGENDGNTISYTIDIAILWPNEEQKKNNNNSNNNNDNNDWLIHTSGLHGVEGYAGSAIQLAYLQHRYELHYVQQQQQQQQHPSLASFPPVMLIHAINPFGMHHFRRVNEHNVDLNRNALNETGWHQRAKLHHLLTKYNVLDQSLFNPPRAPTNWDYYITCWWRALQALRQYGYLTIKRAMVAAQYHQPYGIFYGGNAHDDDQAKLEPSLQILFDFLQDHHILPKNNTNYQDQDGNNNDNNDTSLSSTSSRRSPPKLTWIDVHTGLGPSGQDTFLLKLHHHHQQQNRPGNDNDDDDDGDETFHEHVAKIFSGSLIPSPPSSKKTTQSSSSSSAAAQQVMAGYDLSMGFITDYVYEQWTRHYFNDNTQQQQQKDKDDDDPSQHPLLLLCQEFGTVSSLLVARALILENMAWRFTSPTEHAVWAQRTTRAVFYPDSSKWRRLVLQNGLRVLHQANARYYYTTTTTTTTV